MSQEAMRGPCQVKKEPQSKKFQSNPQYDLQANTDGAESNQQLAADEKEVTENSNQRYPPRKLRNHNHVNSSDAQAEQGSTFIKISANDELRRISKWKSQNKNRIKF